MHMKSNAVNRAIRRAEFSDPPPPRRRPLYHPLKYEVLNKLSKRVVFRDYTYQQALDCVTQNKHLSFRHQQ